MKYIFFLLLLASCVEPARIKRIESENDFLRNRITALENAQISINSRQFEIEVQQTSINVLIDSLQTRQGQTEKFVYYVNAKADSSLSIVFNIDKKALRRYNTGMFLGGVADFFTGGKVSKIIKSVKGIEDELRK